MRIMLEPSRSAWDLNWSIAKIPIRVHPLFWLMALFLSYHDRDPFQYVLIGMVCIFFSILVHEFGHALSGIYYGDRHPRVVLYQMGGLCIGGEAELSRWPKILMILWGPGAGFVLAALAYAIGGIMFSWAWIRHPYSFGGNPYIVATLVELFW